MPKRKKNWGFMGSHRVGARRKRKATRCKVCRKDRYLNDDQLCADCATPAPRVVHPSSEVTHHAGD